jgi:DNA-directed RNA polymerase subunit RPC12/RpoP
MTRMETRCAGCGRLFMPDRDAILAGSWRTCPACRVDGVPKPRPARELVAAGATTTPAREE